MRTENSKYTFKKFCSDNSITQESEDVADYVYLNLLNTGREINLRDTLYFGVELYADVQSCKEHGFTIFPRLNPLFCNVRYLQVLILVNHLGVTMEELLNLVEI